jgi:hypothetical protein
MLDILGFQSLWNVGSKVIDGRAQAQSYGHGLLSPQAVPWKWQYF